MSQNPTDDQINTDKNEDTQTYDTSELLDLLADISHISLIAEKIHPLLNKIFYLRASPHLTLEILGSELDYANDYDFRLFFRTNINLSVNELIIKWIPFNLNRFNLICGFFLANNDTLESLTLENCFFYPNATKNFKFKYLKTFKMINCTLDDTNIKNLFNSLPESLNTFYLIKCPVNEKILKLIIQLLPKSLTILHICSIRWEMKKVNLHWDSLIKLSNLVELVLVDMMLSTNIDVCKLSHLNNLKILSLSYNEFKSFPDLRNINSLEDLDVTKMFCNTSPAISNVLHKLPPTLTVLRICEGINVDKILRLDEDFNHIIFDCFLQFSPPYSIDKLEFYFRATSFNLNLNSESLDIIIEYLENELKNSSRNLSHVDCIQLHMDFDKNTISKCFRFVELFVELKYLHLEIVAPKKSATSFIQTSLENLEFPKKITSLSIVHDSDETENSESFGESIVEILKIFHNVEKIGIDHIRGVENQKFVIDKLKDEKFSFDNLEKFNFHGKIFSDNEALNMILFFASFNTLKELRIPICSDCPISQEIFEKIKSMQPLSVDKIFLDLSLWPDDNRVEGEKVQYHPDIPVFMKCLFEKLPKLTKLDGLYTDHDFQALILPHKLSNLRDFTIEIPESVDDFPLFFENILHFQDQLFNLKLKCYQHLGRYRETLVRLFKEKNFPSYTILNCVEF